MKKTWVFILMTMILFFFASCVNQNSLNPSISLGRLGNEGELFIKGNAYHIIDYPFLGISVVALNRETLPESFSGVQDLSLRSEQMEIAFSTNPYNKAILELTLPDSFPKEQILLMSILPSSKDMTESVADERDDLYLEYVTIQKAVEVNGSNLYQIETMNFISMRNAGVFVFDLLGNFIIPSYVTSNEAYTYAVNTFLSVRNASPDTSISGALTFIKELPAHEDYLEDINPNTVVVEGNDIIVVPPEQDERKLRDLGPEGPLNLPDNVYQILDNTSLFGLWSVSFKSSRLPEPEAAGSSWQLVLNETEFLFYQNIHDPDIYEINLDESLVDDIEQIRDAHFQVADEASCTLTVQSNPQAGGEVRVNEGGWGDVQTVVSIIGQAAILEARENVGYNFDGWYENQQLLSVNNPYTLTANSDRQIEARFSLIPNTPPTVTKVSGPEGTIRETTSSFSWTGSDSGISGRSISHYRYQKDGGTWTTISGTSYTWGHGRGNHTFGVVAVDDEGAESSIVEWVFNSVENVLPTVTKVSGPEGTIRETTSSFSWTGSDSGISGRSISHYRYQKDGGTWTTISGTSYTWGHGRGNHTFGVVAVDDEGAESSIVEWVFNSVENVPPTLTKVSGVSGTTSQTSATFSW
ncbi:MAG TPA: hypothetical protein P5107_10175, partial [Thermotogota bacterium]|nr:hypothetical protein [Thermotogota bacterium]